MNRPIIQRAERLLDTEPRRILDIGSGNAEVALRLAHMGHCVLSITNNEDEVRAGRTLAKQNDRGSGTAEFRQLDATTLRRELHRERFDVVVALNLFHLLPRVVHQQVINDAKSLTNAAGFHVVSGYVLSEDHPEAPRNPDMFRPGELKRYYDFDDQWHIRDYHEDESRAYESAGRMWVDSHAEIIASRIPLPVQPVDIW